MTTTTIQLPKRCTEENIKQVIDYNFQKINQRLTNLSKATIDKLTDIITKYNIDKNEIWMEIQTEKQLEEIKDIERRKEREIEREIEREQEREENEKYEMLFQKHFHTPEYQKYLKGVIKEDKINNQNQEEAMMKICKKLKGIFVYTHRVYTQKEYKNSRNYEFRQYVDRLPVKTPWENGSEVIVIDDDVIVIDD